MTPLETIVETRLGLSPEAIGPEVLGRAATRRMIATSAADPDAYAALVEAEPDEWEALLEELVVPETWFFRIPEAFAELVRFAAERRTGRPCLRIASLPCATGEEPYSIAMALLDAGFPPESFRVDAADISARALGRAEAGIYNDAAFRGEAPGQSRGIGPAWSFRPRHFDATETGYRIRDRVRDRVRFFRGNLLDPGLLADAGPYDAIFCRNLVIYLSERARKRAVSAVNRLLAPDGLLFVGHAEAEAFRAAGFARTDAPRAFACRRIRTDARPETPAPAPGTPSPGSAPLPDSRPAMSSGKTEIRLPGRPTSNRTGRPPSHRVSERIPAGTAGPGNAEPQLGPADPCRESSAPTKNGTRATPAPADDTDLLPEAGRLADEGDLSGALARCRAYLERTPTDPRAHFLAGMIHQTLGDETRAETHFERAVYLDPTHREALHHLAMAAERRGDRSRAERLRTRARRVRERENVE